MSLATVRNLWRRTRAAWRWWWLIWAAAAACVFLCGVVVGLVSMGSDGGGHWFGTLLAPPFGGREQVTILVVGVDDSGSRGLADTILVAVVHPRTGELAGLHLPRDSRVFIPGLGVRRINEAYAHGGLPLMRDTVELLLGVPIDHHIQLCVNGLVELVDAIGGVEIEVEKRMHYRDRAQGLVIDLRPGLQRLDGYQAMGYVRFRQDAHGDLARIERQRSFLRAVARQLSLPQNVARLPKLAQAFVETVETDLSVRDILHLKRMVDRLGPDSVHMETLPGRPRLVGGQSMLVLQEREVQRAVDRILKGVGVSVAVLNGSQVDGLAARAASRLEERGCEVVQVGNAEQPSDTTLVIDHRGQTSRAERVAAWLGCGVVTSRPDGDSAADVTVVVGRDLVERGL